MTNHIGGWLGDQENRDWLKATSAEMPRYSARETVPETLGIAKWMQVENQGGVGSCAGHARTSVLEACIYHQTRGTIVQLSRMYAYRTAQIEDGINGDRGSTIVGNAKAATKGNCLEKYWPYTGSYVATIPQIAIDHAGEYKLRTWRVLQTYQETFDWLAMGLGGVQIGIAWNSSCDRPVIESFNGGGGGGHSVALLDWTSRRDPQGRRYLSLFNSWGRSWGNNGIAEVAPAAIEQMLGNGYTVFVGFSDMEDLKPRDVSWIGKDSVFK